MCALSKLSVMLLEPLKHYLQHHGCNLTLKLPQQINHTIEYRWMEEKNNCKTQEKAIMSYSKLPFHWSRRESQLMLFNSTRQKIVARVEPRAARDSHFCERACREEHHCNKSDTKTNILASFSLCCDISSRADARFMVASWIGKPG
jgi:hypothetical protein